MAVGEAMINYLPPQPCLWCMGDIRYQAVEETAASFTPSVWMVQPTGARVWEWWSEPSADGSERPAVDVANGNGTRPPDVAPNAPAIVGQPAPPRLRAHAAKAWGSLVFHGVVVKPGPP
eukprot:gene14227-37667_t